MKALVLLSDGRHPVSGRPAPAGTELQAIALARGLTEEVAGLYAGPDAAAARTALGHGLARLEHRRLPEGDDPLPSLAAAIAAAAPDLVLAGRRAGAGAQTGLVPYQLAEALGWPLVPDVVALTVADGVLEAVQALPKGARRRWRVKLPALVTVHPAAPVAASFAIGMARSGHVEDAPGIDAPQDGTALEERPYRPRPRLIASAAAGASAAERLKAATQSAGPGGRVMVDPTPEEAARAILEHLRALGVLKPAPGRD
ncbi:electron transfer flavoprotein subunit beta [Ancylobacter oerskovii]|uniref:Electron transfer flavoprotein subunit beta n=1 Tax=Ancylobacter oerskovii TaxID=459519 RepID=A0ABW4YST3_9HYPH|nr:electron transfer flavoprotein subunit beta [Ancylobacter oerskovii]MBS7545244.1 electron transfer flavoprotein subunit beta [Ancylobacter oerskovii]